MANVYGSSLDSLMQNEMAQRAASQAEANSYRNYVNQVANTNLRRREGDSMDRYRTGDIDVRREDVGGMNEFRRGQVNNDANRIQSQERINDRSVRGQENVATIGANANKYMSDNALTGNKYVSDNALTGNKYMSDNQLSGNKYMSDNALTGQKEMVRGQMHASDNALTGQKYVSDNSLSGIRDSNTASMYNTDRMAGANENIASLPYNQLNARDQAIYDTYGAPGLRPQDPNLQLMQMSNQQEQDTARRSAYQGAMDELHKNFNSWNPIDDYRTKQVRAEQERLMGEQGLVSNDQNKQRVYDQALGNVARRVVDTRFGTSTQQPGNGGPRIQSMGQPGQTNAVPSAQGPSPSYDDFMKWKQKQNR